MSESAPVPFTRSLPYVLREQLQKSREGPTVLIGRVLSVPNRSHVTVDIEGASVTVPKLASYSSPIVGEPVHVLADPLATVALGAVSETPLPTVADAETLDGRDSTGFMRRYTFGIQHLWWTKTAPQNTDGSGQTHHAHPLAVVPQTVSALQAKALSGNILYATADATNVHVQWTAVTVLNTEVWLMVIG